MNKKIVITLMAVILAGASVLSHRLRAQEQTKEQKTVTAQKTIRYSIVNIEYKGTKVWVPSVLIVPKGAKVELKLINDAPSGVHGFSVPDFNVKVEVAPGKPQEASFVADKAGLFPINCQLHPAHIGGQLLVLEL